MSLDRRRLFAALAGAGVATAGTAVPALARDVAARPVTDATALGLRPNAPDDQSKALQRAIDQAAAAGTVLQLPAGFYRAGALNLPPHAAIAGVAGMTRIVMAGGPSMLSAMGSDNIALSGLILDGANIPLPERRGLIHLAQGRALRIADCEIVGAGRNGIALEALDGEVTGTTVSAADNAIFSIDARGLRIAGNTVRGAGNGGILVWRTTAGDDGTLVVRAHNVMVRGNRIRNAAFSAVRGNAASNLQILGNTCSAIGEVALYAEFGFEGAMIANNIVDGAALGVSVTNSNEGGRLAVVQGNLIRNLVSRRPAGTDPNDSAGIGIGIEADTAVSGNVIENAPYIGIAAGWGQYLRDVTINANVVRGADYGIAVSVAPGAGAAVIADNMISGARLSAIVGMEWKKPVTGDLAKDGAERYAQLSIAGNRVR
jgi:putative cofactor-binding repeat protein